MAQVRLTSIQLIDNFPGPVNPSLGKPANGWDNTRDCFKSDDLNTDSPSYPLGTKIMAYNDGSISPGWYTMMYGVFHDYSSLDISGDFSHGNIWCCHADGSKVAMYNTETSASPYYVLGRCYTSASADYTRGFPVAVPCWTATADSSVVLSASPYEATRGEAFGWFWVGGVCPVEDVTLFQGKAGSLYGADITVAATLERGPFVIDPTTDPVPETPDASTFTSLDWSYGVDRLIPVAGYTCQSAD